MSLRWLHRVLGRSPSRSRLRKSARPRLEPLEDRWLLSGFEVTTTANAGPGSLRQAILDANATPGTDTITFNIGDGGAQTIRPTSALPAVTDPVVIDGTTQPGFDGSPLIELNGSSAGLSGSIGLSITAGNSTVRGLVINGWRSVGILFQTGGGNRVVGNYIGTDITGTLVVGNGSAGITVFDAASGNNTIGGTTPEERNIISGNISAVSFLNGSSGNHVQGNYIGTDVTGTVALGNIGFGVLVQGGSDNTIGGTAAGARNLLSANNAGVLLTNGTRDNHVLGNYIGTDVTGSRALANLNGVLIQGAANNNTVGGTVPGAGNLVSGNQQFGISIGLGATANRVEGNFLGTNAAGTAALGNARGVVVTSPNNTVGGSAPGAGNLISGNRGHGVELVGVTNIVVRGNVIGTDATGTAALPNNGDGIIVAGSGNLIGGPGAGAGNLISGNLAHGIEVVSGTGNRIEGNQIGTDVAGTRALGNFVGVQIDAAAAGNLVGMPASGNLISGNRASGVLLAGVGNLVLGNLIGADGNGAAALGNQVGVSVLGSGNTIGGTAPGAGNVISGNLGNGVSIFSGATRLQGNLIGTDATGSRALGGFGNFGEGVSISSSGNLIGGTALGAGNLISGNARNGILVTGGGNLVQGNRIGTDVSGTAAVGNGFSGVEVRGSNNTIGGTEPAARNLLSGNGPNSAGVTLQGNGNQVVGNYIGTDVSGLLSVENGNGVIIAGGANNLIGGTTAEARNVISGNRGGGVTVQGFAGSGNRVQGNFVGTDATGTAALGNNQGVFASASGTTIGGTEAGAGNLISGNRFNGVWVSNFISTTNIQVQGNLIGTDVTGTVALGNDTGVFITNVPGAAVGGTEFGAGNLISGNRDRGVLIVGSGTRVQGNLIGTDATGAQPLGNGNTGVEINGGSSNLIGGAAAGAGNVISSNDGAGVYIFGGAARLNQVQGNLIGTDISGAAPLGNAGRGVFIDGSSDNTVGGTAGSARNTIAFNPGGGVGIDRGTGNAILTNAIFANGGLGIELRNGGNRGQPAPVLTAASSSGGITTIQGTLTAAANSTFTIQLFASAPRDTSGAGEGERFLGSLTVTTDAQGQATFTFTVAIAVELGQLLTATATDAGNNTSAFSAALVVGDS